MFIVITVRLYWSGYAREPEMSSKKRFVENYKINNFY